MKCVVDTAMAIAWLCERNKPEEADCADHALLAFADAEVSVPSL